jgi:cellulose 1,4-beta-cellobiosidase
MRKLRRYAASVTVVLLGVAGLAAATIAMPAVANAATGCSAAYSVATQWSTGFTAGLTITNNGTTAITGWTVTYSYPSGGNQALQQTGWSGTWSQSGQDVTVTNLSWNGSVAPGSSVSGVGANFNFSGTNTAPATVTCTAQGGSTTGNTVTVTNPGARSTTVGTAASLQIQASDSAAGQTLTYAATGLPAGLAISTSGLISGTPTTAGTSNVTVTAQDATGASGTATFAWTVTAANGNPTIQATQTSLSIVQGASGTVGISLSAAPTANVTVTTARTAGNTGLSVSGGSSLTFTPANFATAQNVTFTANATGTGSATFTASATGLPSVTITVNELAGNTGGGHVADPFTGTKPYLNPDFVSEVNAQATADGSAAEGRVAQWETAIWLDSKASITNGNTGSGGHTSLMQQLTNAAAAGTAATPSLVEIVVYDLPGRDCAALASNGEIPATSAGLTDYETNYINPIASILTQFATANIRVVAIIEPDSLPNAVTNTNMQTCSTAAPFYEQGTTYALNKLHAIPNVYNYMDIAHSAWLGWPDNMSRTPAVYNTVVKATTAGYDSIDGFISDTANYTPTQEPLLTNPTLQVGGQNVDSATYYSFNPTFDELTYDTQMYNTLMAAGFPASKKFLIDTSRNGWGPTHPTTITNASTPDAYVAANKIDARPFRGDWCNQNNAGIGARPADQPLGSSSPILAFVWIKPPGESDGDYPTSTHSHGDPHCDPSLNNQTDGSGHSFNTGSIPGFDVAAGAFFPAEFQMLVRNAFPAM